MATSRCCHEPNGTLPAIATSGPANQMNNARTARPSATSSQRGGRDREQAAETVEHQRGVSA